MRMETIPTTIGKYLKYTILALGLVASACSPEQPPAAGSQTQPSEISAPKTGPQETGTPETVATPLIIAHRGASGYMPEHSIEAYKLAIDMGADYIEPDLVMTKDAVLVSIHNPWLSTTTNVADHPEFADRKREIELPYQGKRTDWWVQDFTLEELKTLRLVQAHENRNQEFNGQFLVPTFEEVIALAKSESETKGRTIGIYPEAKAPTAFINAGLDIEAAILTALDNAGWTTKDAPVYLQCFEPDFLKNIRPKTDVKLVQLIFPDPSKLGGPSVPLDYFKPFADGVGPHKALILNPATGEPTALADQIKDLGLEMHPWTFRNDEMDKVAWTDDPIIEMQAAIKAGATGVFTDFPDTGAEALRGE